MLQKSGDKYCVIGPGGLGGRCEREWKSKRLRCGKGQKHLFILQKTWGGCKKFGG